MKTHVKVIRDIIPFNLVDSADQLNIHSAMFTGSENVGGSKKCTVCGGILGNSSKKRRKSPETSRRDWALCLCISLIHPITRLSRKNKPGHLDIDIDAVEQADKLGILDQEKPGIEMNTSLMTLFPKFNN